MLTGGVDPGIDGSDMNQLADDLDRNLGEW
jgi:hypothetical protein